MLSTLQQQSPTPSPPPPYTTTTTSPTTFPTPDVKPHTAPSVLPPVIDNDDDDDNEEDAVPPQPSLHIHISAPTTINGSHDRVVLPSPKHLSSLVSVAVKLALQQGEEGEVNEDEHQISVTVDAATKIEGNGNVIVFDGRKDRGSISGNANENSSALKGARTGDMSMARKRRASSEPIDVKRIMKQVKT
ncbi:MAG: hypothetical protein Q9221_000655 [Calogaya cf. arnoldii]